MSLKSCCLVLVIVPLASSVAWADPETEARINHARAMAVKFLATTQADDGSWTAPTSPGITGLVTYAILRSGTAPSDPFLAKSLKHLESFIQPDGGIYDPKGNQKNYETSIAVMVFAAANKEGKYTKTIEAARDYLKKLQWGGTPGSNRADVKFGGAGYGRTGDRPDLSNTAFLVEALKAAGVDKDDDAMKNAIVFISRTQNLETEHNTTEHAAKVNDGGFYYTPALGGQSQAGKTDNGGLRSYASMTYAGLKSMIYAGLTPDDPRVKAATEWIKKHYTLKENPGMGQSGLFYYYQTYAKALAVLGQDKFEDAEGIPHDWRRELTQQLLSMQKENGSWVNPEPRWMEGDPNMATAYALIALSYCVPEKK